jgi:pterin-4a-carbinolamine dehydratase
MRRGVIFVSYRRNDAGPFALALAAELELKLAGIPVFIDLNRIVGGNQWSDALDDALGKSRLVLALIGRNWSGRRGIGQKARLFDETDWVRKEVRHGLDGGQVVPVLLNGARVPNRLPRDLQALRKVQQAHLRTATWSNDIDALCSALGAKGFAVRRGDEILPKANPGKSKFDPLPPAVLDPWLNDARNAGWRVFAEYDRRDTLSIREYLRKTFNFQADSSAFAFMGALAELTERLKHHPIVQAKYKSVTISLSTWDARHQITKFDAAMAEEVDRLAARWPQDSPS